MACDKNASITVLNKAQMGCGRKRIWSHGEDVRLAVGDEDGVAGAVDAD